jgi:hypothetical protein
MFAAPRRSVNSAAYLLLSTGAGLLSKAAKALFDDAV